MVAYGQVEVGDAAQPDPLPANAAARFASSATWARLSRIRFAAGRRSLHWRPKDDLGFANNFWLD